jgi:alpha-L-fucosidase 2
MRPIIGVALMSTLLQVFHVPVMAASTEKSFVAVNDVTWRTLGNNENDSMPIGNGDLAANVWTEQNGDLVLLIAKSDAWSEMGKLLKLSRVRVHIAPNPFAGAVQFVQTLHLEDGSIEIRSGKNVVQVWVDANRPVIHIEARLEQPATLDAKLELWRTKTHPYNEPSPDKGGLFELGKHPVPLDFEADTVMPGANGQVTWYHYNAASLYPLVLEQEHMQAVANKYPDPLLHRCFGAAITGAGLVAVDDHTLRSVAAAESIRLDVVALTQAQAPSPAAWRTGLDSLVAADRAAPYAAELVAHRQWWRDFWQRSWIHVEGTDDAAKVSQGYIMQRYMMAASSRGEYPAKFNGGLFTVGHDMPDDKESTNADHNPDFRAWGSSYWNQNNRLLYWPLIMTGDFDLLKTWFDMYLKALPMAEDRTEIYYHHAGAAFIETGYFWGLPNLNDFGWDNASTQLQSAWMRYHIQGTLEVIAQMLDEYDVVRDANFARTKIVPFADAILTYYDLHWPHTPDGKLRLTPVQSLETYQVAAVNPTPDLAGMKHVLTRLLQLSPEDAAPAQRDLWRRMLEELPPIAVGKTAKGKLPPLGVGDPDGTPTILPAEAYGKTSNAENPELYTVFPYRLYGLDKPDLELARNTFAARRFPFDHCWGQDGPQAAVLGITATAQKAVTDEFELYGPERFQWFWKAGGDWIPDLDNGGTGMMTLQLMLMQTDGKRIDLLPAWPKDWTADFKLHAPYRTTVEGHVANGKITGLRVTPNSRAKDVVIVGKGGRVDPR